MVRIGSQLPRHSFQRFIKLLAFVDRFGVTFWNASIRVAVRAAEKVRKFNIAPLITALLNIALIAAALVAFALEFFNIKF